MLAVGRRRGFEATAQPGSAAIEVASRAPTVVGDDEEIDPLLFDDFNYTLSRIDTAANKRAIVGNHGWTWLKDNNDSPGARGYIYTVDEIEGYEGVIPGNSGRALCIEGQSNAQQGDLYLQFGDNEVGDIPMPIWIQFWMYINRSGSQMSSFNGGGKFIYPLASGDQSFFPAPTRDTSLLGGFSTSFFNSSRQQVSAPETGAVAWVMESFPDSSEAFLSNVPENERRADVHALRSDLYPRMGPWSVSGDDCWLFPNTWYLIRYRGDLSGSQGIHEFWRREMGESFLKTHEWIGGTTSGFNWNVFDIDPLGWRLFRMPVTLRGDFWVYLTDFTLANSVDDLPTYSSY